MSKYYEGVGIFHQKSVLRTPQQNGVVERLNRTLVEAARTMLIFSKALMFLWAEAVATACYTQNRSLIHTRHNETPYELVHDKKPDLTFLRVFGALCYLINDSEDLGKLQAKADIGIFVGYAPSKKGFRIYNKRTRRIMETIHVTFDELHQTMALVRISSGPEPIMMTPGQLNSGLAPSPRKTHSRRHPQSLCFLHPSFNPVTGEPGSAQSSSGNVNSTEPNQVNQPPDHLRRWTKDHPLDNIIGNPSRPISTRKQLASDALWCCFHTNCLKVNPKLQNGHERRTAGFQAMQDEIPRFEDQNNPLTLSSEEGSLRAKAMAPRRDCNPVSLSEGMDTLKSIHYGVTVNFTIAKCTTAALSIENGSLFEGESKFEKLKIYLITLVSIRSDWEDIPWLFRSVEKFVLEPMKYTRRLGFIAVKLKTIVILSADLLERPSNITPVDLQLTHLSYLRLVDTVNRRCKSAGEPDLPTTTTPVKPTKPPSSKKPKSPTKKPSKRKLPQKVRKGKPSFQLVDKDEEAQQESFRKER
ncbi:retrovirus-related pol polyprotein from transposon TNT 1-94 [Tanacetum coccineum]